MNFKVFTEAVQRLTRGMANISPDDGWPLVTAMKLINGKATAGDVLSAFPKHLGYHWHREGEDGSEVHDDNLEDSKEFAYTESDVLLKNAITYLNDPGDELINGSIAVAFVAEVPKPLRPNDWDSSIPSNTRLTIKEIHYNAGNGWNVINCNIAARP